MDPNNAPLKPNNPSPQEQPPASIEEKPAGDKMNERSSFTNKLSGFAGEMISKHYEGVLRTIVAACLWVLKLVRYFIQQFISQVFSR